ncbi:MAG: lysylphosphatidylglycerol synthase transmembrane domain-containing protein [Actinomycetota bacterium]|nr:lysylphosphatidylglycerol synthase transmembrane domain-containing protein [Actinomycetota bacterium]
MNRYFASDPRQARVRRATDIWVVVIGLILVLWTAANVDRVVALEVAIMDLSQSVPTWFEQVYKVAYFFGLLLVWAVVISVISQGKDRLDLLRDIAVAMATAVGIILFIIWWLDGSIPTVLPEFTSRDPGFTFPILRVSVLTSVITVSAPHLARPVRRFGWLMIVLVAISGFGLGLGLPGDALGGIGLGLLSGGAVLLVFGSPQGYPDRHGVAAGLGDLGLRIAEVELASDRSWGVRRLVGSLDDGTSIEVKAYGRDATDSQFLSKAWQSLWYREGGQTFTYSRLQAVEHEALALVMAQHHGVATPEILAVGVGGEDMALLVTTRRGESLQHQELTMEVLTAVWRQVDLLHRAGIAHGALTLNAVTIDDGRPVLGDLTAASLSATDIRKSLDVVSLLFSTAVVVGGEDAVAAACAGLGDESMVGAMAYLQVPALARTERRLVEKPKVLVSDLREAIAAVTGAESPEPAKLRRVRPKDLIMPALSLVAAYALIGMLADIDFVAVWDVMETAAWLLIIFGFVIGQTAFFPDATGMLFATGYPLPLKPLVVLQVSVKWIGLAIPSAAGRVTMNTLFLRKYGVSPTLALTQGALDGLSGFAVEAGVLLVALIASDLSLDLDTSDVRLGLILLIVAVLIVATAVAILRIKRLRENVLPVLKDAWGMLWSLLKDPKRTFGLLGSNLASRAILAVTLWSILQAIGTPLPLVMALVATVATNLLAGLVPIPGGIGIAEAVLTSFLIVAGLGSEEAFAAAVVFRIATFYIPAGEGFFAMKWLERNGHL